ncbi:GrpB family protein [Herbiconiux sp. CPCC 205716]|uniref:GrpB family protein n=1 Tax=Herbiconiux gentiana TaxID=2970912 RepID=A0ABT2GJ94_9MICO|nr:GrpB family protein [Herbiconiux gentiana]MCS5716291.1 GrpB family protein [Herbiconiux gentiana]
MQQNEGPRRPEVTTVEIIGGPERLTVGLHEHDPAWATVFESHRRVIQDALADVPADARPVAIEHIAVEHIAVEHIGSTAVPGLAAKPIVDIVVAVGDITAEEHHVDRLVAAGYELRVREPGHRLVRTPERDVHVHLYQQGDPAIAEYLLLRDHLRADAGDRALYESTKRALMAESWADMNAYSDAKTEVIAAIKERARRAAGADASHGGVSDPPA